MFLHKREFVACIIDAFEGFLDSKGIKIENSERDAQGDDNSANIWGDDFDDLMESVISILKDEGIDVADNFNDGEDGAIIRLYNEFNALIAKSSFSLPKIGRFDITILNTKTNNKEEIEKEKPSEAYSWDDFFKSLIEDIKEIKNASYLTAFSIINIAFVGDDFH